MRTRKQPQAQKTSMIRSRLFFRHASDWLELKHNKLLRKPIRRRRKAK